MSVGASNLGQSRRSVGRSVEKVAISFSFPRATSFAPIQIKAFFFFFFLGSSASPVKREASARSDRVLNL
ncbi:hypothetical protein BCV70DRAFT_101861 [Testicularia cyperi]|uniref:Uncharacterized protein n=1 Tax=Testicularia cyperi TaxID=1882483 RepID=A0A317XG99_9BASI|nr:hypothetical protein BCV70DRAFT_101861 [Testicularia cyperi]